MQQIALMNDEARFGQVADDRLDDIVAENAERNTEFMKLYFDNNEFQKAIKEAARKRAYRIITDPARDEALARLRAEMARETGVLARGDGVTELLAGRYRIDGLLGRGGMSEVYHGYDERLDRRVAIKVLRPPGQVPAAPDSPEAVEILDALDRDRKRFLREIRVTAQLEHPGTPAVYDTGVETAPDGTTRLWLVMQLLRGSTLEALLNHADYAVVAAVGGVGGGDRGADRRGARRRAPRRHRAPRHQARQRDDRRRRPGEGAGLRHRDPARCRGAAPADPGRPHRRHPRVHVARAVPRPGRDRRVRHLLAGVPAPGAAHRRRAVLRDGGHAAALAPPEHARAVRAVPAGRRTRGAGHAGVLDAGEGPGRAADGSGGVRGAAAADDNRTRTGRAQDGWKNGQSARRGEP